MKPLIKLDLIIIFILFNNDLHNCQKTLKELANIEPNMIELLDRVNNNDAEPFILPNVGMSYSIIIFIYNYLILF